MSHRTTYLIALSLLLAPLLLSPQSVSAAAKKPTGIKLGASAVFSSVDDNGATLTCATIKGRKVAGTYKRGYFNPSSNSLKNLSKQVKAASGNKKKKLKAKLTLAQQQVAAKNAICNEGPDPLVPLSRGLTEADIRYLYEKTAFGAVTPNALNIGLTQGVGPLVDHLMTKVDDSAVEHEAAQYQDEDLAASKEVTNNGVQLWALHLMLKTNNPYHERFAFLFLHNLLATSMEVLTDSTQKSLMVDHLNKMRAAASHGNYRALLKDVTRDPVMLIWLNGNQNTKQQPNENFARELMELFTLAPSDKDGNPNYSETTVAQVARACTGWTVQFLPVPGGAPVWSSVFGQAIYDTDPNKVIFEGTSYQGHVSNDFSVIDHIFDNHPNVDDFLATRIAKEYLNETPSDRAVKSIARMLKASGYNFTTVMSRLLKSEEFYKEANRNSIIVGPVEKLVTFIRATKIPYNFNTLRSNIASSGQIISQPPTVFGWDNPDWPTGQWLLIGANAINQIIRDNSVLAAGGFNYGMLLPSPTATDMETINGVAARLNVSLTPDQQNAMFHYMNNNRNSNGSFSPSPWDPANSTKVRNKVAGLLEIVTRTADFQTR